VYTLPVLRTLASGTPAAAELRALLGGPLEIGDRDAALAIVRSNHGVDSAIATAQQYAANATAACDLLPEGPATDALRRAPADLIATVMSPTT